MYTGSRSYAAVIVSIMWLSCDPRPGGAARPAPRHEYDYLVMSGMYTAHKSRYLLLPQVESGEWNVLEALGDERYRKQGGGGKGRIDRGDMQDSRLDMPLPW